MEVHVDEVLCSAVLCIHSTALSVPTLFVSLGFWNKWPQAGCLKATEMYPLHILEDRRSKLVSLGSNCVGEVVRPLEALGENPSHLSSFGWPVGIV